MNPRAGLGSRSLCSGGSRPLLPASSCPCHQGLTPQGLTPQGLTPQGLTPWSQASHLRGPHSQGPPPQGPPRRGPGWRSLGATEPRGLRPCAVRTAAGGGWGFNQAREPDILADRRCRLRACWPWSPVPRLSRVCPRSRCPQGCARQGGVRPCSPDTQEQFSCPLCAAGPGEEPLEAVSTQTSD